MDLDEKIINGSLIGFKEFKKGDNKHFYLYKIRNKLDNKIYIGVRSYKGVDPNNDRYFGSGIIRKKNDELIVRGGFINSHFHNSIKKYGISNFEKEILCYFKDHDSALRAESKIVDEEFVRSNKTLNMVLGGGLPPIRKGKLNGNYGKFWSDSKKKALSKKLKDSDHSNGGNNCKAKKAKLFDLINDKAYELNYLKEAKLIKKEIKECFPLRGIISFQFYLITEKYSNLSVEESINLFGVDKTKKVFKLINEYKKGVLCPNKLGELTGLRLPYIKRFLKNIKDEKSNKH